MDADKICIKSDYKKCDDFDGNLAHLHAKVIKAVGDIAIEADKMHLSAQAPE